MTESAALLLRSATAEIPGMNSDGALRTTWKLVGDKENGGAVISRSERPFRSRRRQADPTAGRLEGAPSGRSSPEFHHQGRAGRALASAFDGGGRNEPGAAPLAA